ncbi:MAG: D-glycero-beta-D-manno-heptose-7-phosphate kinase, partial [Flavobacteriales bacterium]|nr:D-glycero-beta-D-manno-heptose-7-phosphate kinase [Flavobacteriales bacterium]
LVEQVVLMCTKQGIPTCVDPKKKNFLNYQNTTLFKPNKKELEEGLNIDLKNCNIANLSKAHSSLQKILNHSISLITLSDKGVFIATKDSAELIPAHLRNISDVSGAGDTVISVAALCLSCQVDNTVLAHISNLAGGLVCEKVGVVPIDKNRLLEESIRLYGE